MTDERTGPLGQLGAPATAPSPDPAGGRDEEVGKLGEGARADIFEVFRQEKDGDPMRHAGNVSAPDVELATHYARELYGRRQESVRLWVVPRAQITDLSDPDLLQPPLDRTFKKPGGYVMRDKLEQAKRRAGTRPATDELTNPHGSTDETPAAGSTDGSPAAGSTDE